MLLFYPKNHAERAFKEAGLIKDAWCVRSMPHYIFRALLLQLELFDMKGFGAAVLVSPSGALKDNSFITLPAPREDLIAEYYEGNISSIK